jgi:hypothetical protein
VYDGVLLPIRSIYPHKVNVVRAADGSGGFVTKPVFTAPEEATRAVRQADMVSIKWVIPSLTGAAVQDGDGVQWFRIGGVDAEAGFAARSNNRTKRRHDQRSRADEKQKLARRMDDDVCAAAHAAFARVGWRDRERCQQLMLRLAQPPPQGVTVEQVTALARSGVADDALVRAACPKAVCKNAICVWLLAAREKADVALHERRVTHAVQAAAPGGSASSCEALVSSRSGSGVS